MKDFGKKRNLAEQITRYENRKSQLKYWFLFNLCSLFEEVSYRAFVRAGKNWKIMRKLLPKLVRRKELNSVGIFKGVSFSLSAHFFYIEVKSSAFLILHFCFLV